MILVTRLLEFDTGHRLVGHESKCANLHGHRYKVEATIVAPKLDDVGRVMDFGVVKELLGTWLDEHWDHTLVLWAEDPDLKALQALKQPKPIFVLPQNPSAENMAWYLLHKVCPMLFAAHPVEVVSIKMYETPNCFAVCKLDRQSL
jgi:6-pyruvoyltetrahydropterin/6-carboxytetrahydropterin synthase